MRTNMAPSPSTRASASTLIVRVMGFPRGPERLGAGVERAVHPYEVAVVEPELAQPPAHRGRVGGLHRPEAAVAAAVEGRAQAAAAGVRHRAQARRPLPPHHADLAAPPAAY